MEGTGRRGKNLSERKKKREKIILMREENGQAN